MEKPPHCMPSDQETVDICLKALMDRPGSDLDGLFKIVMVESNGKLNPGFVMKTLKWLLG
jgi:hypothetical protein